MEDGSSAGTPATCGGDLSAPPGSWLLPGSALAVAVSHGVSQGVEKLRLPLPIPLT